MLEGWGVGENGALKRLSKMFKPKFVVFRS